MLLGDTLVRTARSAMTRFDENTKRLPLWREFLPRVERDIQKAGLDCDPVNLPELLAKALANSLPGNRGFILNGSVGSGKTERMNFFGRIGNIRLYSASTFGDVWLDCENDNEFREFCRVDNVSGFTPERYQDLIIDDLGTERTVYSRFGNACDVMRDLVLPWRYGVFPRCKTYFTTNLSDSDLRNRYGERVFSRLNEMCVFIRMDGKDRRMYKGA